MRRSIGILGAVVIASPLVLMLAGAFHGDPEWRGAFDAERLLRSGAIAAGAAALAVLAGLPAGLALASARAKRLWLALTLVPLMVPPGLAAIEWIALGLRPGPVAAAVVLGATLWPIAALLVAAERFDAHAVEAAKLGGASLWRTVVGPALRRPLLDAFVVAFLLAAADFSVAGTFAVNVQAYEILVRLEAHAGGAAATVASLPNLALGAIAACLVRVPVAAAPSYRAAPIAGRACWGAALVVWTLTAVVPAVAILRGMGPLGETWLHHGEKVALTLWTAGAAAIALAAWACLARGPARPWMAGLVVPGVLLSIGLMPMRDAGAGLVLAYLSRYAFIAVVGVRAALAAAPEAPQEAARLAGASPWRLVVWPHARPGLLATAAIVFVLCLGDVGAQALLVPIGNETVMLRLFNLIHWGYDEMVASLAGLHLLAIWTTTAVTALLK